MTRAEKDTKLAELEERKSDLYTQRSKLSKDFEQIQSSRSTINDQIRTSQAILDDLNSKDKQLQADENNTKGDIEKLDSNMSDIDHEIEETIKMKTDD